MPSRAFKIGVFTLEGLNAIPLSVYFMYIFFLMRDRYGFGDMENLLFGGFGGFIYMAFSALGGKVAPRFGYLNTITASLALMVVVFPFGLVVQSMWGQLLIHTIGVAGMAFVWAQLESLAVQGEPKRRVQKMVGIYNLVWSGMAALGFFLGGAIMDRFGFGAMFLIPTGVHLIQLLIALWLQRVERRDFGRAHSGARQAAEAGVELHDEADLPHAATFLKMAWIANPFAFVATNTVGPSIPELARDFGLSKTAAGFLISVWMFSRFAGFIGCWLWEGWHYRMRWLWGAFAAMTVTFVLILTVPLLSVLIVAQVVFGLSIGMIYYSSLYYSMHVGDNHGEQGGIHEAAIGAGNCVGPWIGAAALFLLPGQPNAAVWAVGALLVGGLIWIGRIWAKAR